MSDGDYISLIELITLGASRAGRAVQRGMGPDWKGAPPGVQYSAYSYVKVYTKVRGHLEEDEVCLVLVAIIALLSGAMVLTIVVRNCCWGRKRIIGTTARKESVLASNNLDLDHC